MFFHLGIELGLLGVSDEASQAAQNVNELAKILEHRHHSAPKRVKVLRAVVFTEAIQKILVVFGSQLGLDLEIKIVP